MGRSIAFYGGSFDPVHNGHLAIATAVLNQFSLDEFVFIPAFHAPHKTRLKPTSAYDRFAMLCLATADSPRLSVSRMEIEVPERPYSVETLSRIKSEMPDDRVFFVMGADSWRDILTWREWETVLNLNDHIVITRPGVEIGFDHVTDDIRKHIVDLRGQTDDPVMADHARSIFISDRVNLDISATEIRKKVREGDPSWKGDVPPQVANYVEKYQIYS